MTAHRSRLTNYHGNCNRCGEMHCRGCLRRLLKPFPLFLRLLTPFIFSSSFIFGFIGTSELSVRQLSMAC